MAKVIFSQTQRFIDIRNAVIDICISAAQPETDTEQYIDIVLIQFLKNDCPNLRLAQPPTA